MEHKGHLRKKVDGVLDRREAWLVNNQFLFSDDNFETTQSVFGEYRIDGQTYWGLLASAIHAGLVEGSHIIGGTIKIGEQDDGTYAFEVEPDGTVTMNKGDAAEKLSYFNFDGDKGLVVGENKDGEYFSRISPERIEFCRKARIKTVYSKPSSKNTSYDYYLYQYTSGDLQYYEYYKMSDLSNYEERSIGANFKDPEVRFGIPITFFANDTAYMKQAEIEGDLKVGTSKSYPSISLGTFKLQIEANGSLSIISI